jgi:hypothetical protein
MFAFKMIVRLFIFGQKESSWRWTHLETTCHKPLKFTSGSEINYKAVETCPPTAAHLRSFSTQFPLFSIQLDEGGRNGDGLTLFDWLSIRFQPKINIHLHPDGL